MVDLIQALALPVLVVVRSSLGTINHTLLTLDSLRSRSLVVAGVVMVGEKNHHNRAAIETYGQVAVIGEMPRLDPLSAETLAAWAAAELDPRAKLMEWLQ